MKNPEALGLLLKARLQLNILRERLQQLEQRLRTDTLRHTLQQLQRLQQHPPSPTHPGGTPDRDNNLEPNYYFLSGTIQPPDKP